MYIHTFLYAPLFSLSLFLSEHVSKMCVFMCARVRHSPLAMCVCEHFAQFHSNTRAPPFISKPNKPSAIEISEKCRACIGMTARIEYIFMIGFSRSGINESSFADWRILRIVNGVCANGVRHQLNTVDATNIIFLLNFAQWICFMVFFRYLFFNGSAIWNHVIRSTSLEKYSNVWAHNRAMRVRPEEIRRCGLRWI